MRKKRSRQPKRKQPRKLRRINMGKADEMKGKTVTFFLNNKPVKGKILGFKLPGFLVKGEGIPKDTKLPAMAMKYLRVED